MKRQPFYEKLVVLGMLTKRPARNVWYDPQKDLIFTAKPHIRPGKKYTYLGML